MAEKKINVLFICMGNICRSPAAEGVMKHVLEERGLSERFHVDSAGTIDFHAGNPADRRMRAAAQDRGYDLTSISRGIRASDLKEFDLILCADRDNLFHVNALDRTGEYKDRIHLMLEYGGQKEVTEVPDPYYGGPEGFENVLDLLEGACNGIIDRALKEVDGAGQS